MGGMPLPMGNMPFAYTLALLLLSLAVNLAGVLVALDVRDRGLSKMSAVLWFFAVIALFGLPAAFYMLIRNGSRPGHGRTGVADPQLTRQEPRQSFCPYCGAPQQPEAKICPSCSKFL